MGPCFFLQEHLLSLFHRKTHWTISVGIVGLKIYLLGTSNSLVTLTIFQLCKQKYLGRVQQQITNIAGP